MRLLAIVSLAVLLGFGAASIRPVAHMLSSHARAADAACVAP